MLLRIFTTHMCGNCVMMKATVLTSILGHKYVYKADGRSGVVYEALDTGSSPLTLHKRT